MSYPVVKCGQLPCHSCDAWLTNRTDPTPSCNRTMINCDDEKYFCGIVAIRSNTSALAYRYREMCIDHVICINTTAACPRPGCYLYCCHQGLCNKYDKVSEIVNINYHLAAILTPVTKQPEVTKTININQTTKSEAAVVTPVTKQPHATKKINIKQTTDSSASLLPSSKIVLVSIFFMICKYCI